MTPQETLIELLDRVGAAQGGSVTVSEDELRQWPSAAVKAMKSQKLLARARPANSVVCPGCEEECVMPVHTLPATLRSSAHFILCDKRSDVNRVAVSAEKITCWWCDANAVAGFLAGSLGLIRSNEHSNDPRLLRIGIACGEKRRQMLCLRIDEELALVAGDSVETLAEFVRYSDGRYSVDVSMIGQFVDSVTESAIHENPSQTPPSVLGEMHEVESKRGLSAQIGEDNRFAGSVGNITKAGPKGPRQKTISRCRLIGSCTDTGRDLCKYLNGCKVPLPSKKLQTIYRGDWVSWFNADPGSVYKQISADRKRFRKLV
jgi:hypothetical protein